MITTGCRIGEVLGLKWKEDIDFENRTISINKTIHFSKASNQKDLNSFTPHQKQRIVCVKYRDR